MFIKTNSSNQLVSSNNRSLAKGETGLVNLDVDYRKSKDDMSVKEKALYFFMGNKIDTIKAREKKRREAEEKQAEEASKERLRSLSQNKVSVSRNENVMKLDSKAEIAVSKLSETRGEKGNVCIISYDSGQCRSSCDWIKEAICKKLSGEFIGKKVGSSQNIILKGSEDDSLGSAVEIEVAASLIGLE